MNIQIALLRAVNVGGTCKLPMADLRKLAERIGLTDVRTLIQSGNLVFDAGKRSPVASEALLEKACAAEFGLKTDIYVRTPTELDQIITGNPFGKETKDAPAFLHVLFMREAPPAVAFKALQSKIKGRETVKAGGRHAYIFFPDGAGASKLTAAVLARHLGTPGTARNWNTVTKLAAMTHA
jgi:uncharacterized protein (DUF1697 family)